VHCKGALQRAYNNMAAVPEDQSADSQHCTAKERCNERRTTWQLCQRIVDPLQHSAHCKGALQRAYNTMAAPEDQSVDLCNTLQRSAATKVQQRWQRVRGSGVLTSVTQCTAKRALQSADNIAAVQRIRVLTSVTQCTAKDAATSAQATMAAVSEDQS
jgi:hypothetical protein